MLCKVMNDANHEPLLIRRTNSKTSFFSKPFLTLGKCTTSLICCNVVNRAETVLVIVLVVRSHSSAFEVLRPGTFTLPRCECHQKLTTRLAKDQSSLLCEDRVSRLQIFSLVNRNTQGDFIFVSRVLKNHANLSLLLTNSVGRTSRININTPT